MCDASSTSDTLPADYGDDDEEDVLPDSGNDHPDSLPADYGEDEDDVLPENRNDHLPLDPGAGSMNGSRTHKVNRDPRDTRANSDVMSIRSSSGSRSRGHRVRDPLQQSAALTDFRPVSDGRTSSTHPMQKSAVLTDLRPVLTDPRALGVASTSSTHSIQKSVALTDPRALYPASTSSTHHVPPPWSTGRAYAQRVTRNTIAGVPAPFSSAPQTVVFLADTWNHGVGISGTMHPKSTPHSYLLVPHIPRTAGFRDGPYPYAMFNHPMALSYADASCGFICVIADTCNNAIRVLDVRTANVTTVAGGGVAHAGFRDGPASMALFNQPFGCAIDLTSGGTVVYVADTYNHCIRRLCVRSAHVTTLAGAPSALQVGGFNDGDAIHALFSAPTALAVSGDQIFVADSANHRIRLVHMKNGRWEVRTVGGIGVRGRADGDARLATFNYPMGVALDGSGKILYVADSMNYCVRRINLEACSVQTLAWRRYAFKPTSVIVVGEHLYVKDEDTRRYHCLRTDEAMCVPGALQPLLRKGDPPIPTEATHAFCTTCCQLMPYSQFSAQQLKLPLGSRRCATCIQNMAPSAWNSAPSETLQQNIDITSSVANQVVDSSHSSSRSRRSSRRRSRSHRRAHKRSRRSSKKESRQRIRRRKRSRSNTHTSSKRSTMMRNAADANSAHIAPSSLGVVKEQNESQYAKGSTVSGRKNMTKLPHYGSLFKEAEEETQEANARRTEEEEFRALIDEEFKESEQRCRHTTETMPRQEQEYHDAEAEHEAEKTRAKDAVRRACKEEWNEDKVERRTRSARERNLDVIDPQEWTEDEFRSFLEKEFDEEERTRQTAQIPSSSGEHNPMKIVKEEPLWEEDPFHRVKQGCRAKKENANCADSDYLSDF
eukprot:GEMP01014517.1.p1 GENE.GEMP01014517.1~~GEMP01014517.1.p1  ORF type:complete len:886 (+),score=199.92 GEMP01014517.1:108-2765(+)